jgi:hypothetical protein
MDDMFNDHAAVKSQLYSFDFKKDVPVCMSTLSNSEQAVYKMPLFNWKKSSAFEEKCLKSSFENTLSLSLVNSIPAALVLKKRNIKADNLKNKKS